MTEATSVILAALVGAAGGLAGGAFAALASIRASQLAARAPLGPMLHEISNALIDMRVAQAAKDNQEYLVSRREFERRWGEFSIQQRILCPSERIASLMELVLAIGRNESDVSEALLTLAGQTMEKITQMVGAHGNSLFRFRARREEARIIRRWLESEPAKRLSQQVQTRLRDLI